MATITQTRVNLATNPGMEYSTSIATQRTNNFANPRFTADTAGVPALCTAYTSGAPTGTRSVTGVVQTAATTSIVATGRYGTLCTQTISSTTNDITCFINYTLTGAAGAIARLYVDVKDAGNAVVGHADVSGTTSGTLSVTITPGSAAVTVLMYWWIENTSGSTIATTVTATWQKPFIEVNTQGGYFDGSLGVVGDFTYNWSGTADASASQEKASIAPNLTGATGTGGLTNYFRSADTPLKGAYCGRIRWVRQAQAGVPGAIYTQTVSGNAGDVVSGRISVRSSVAHNVGLTLRFRNGSTVVGTKAVAEQLLTPGQWTEYVAENLTATGSYTNIQLYLTVNNADVMNLGDLLDVDGILLQAGPTAGWQYDGNSGQVVASTYSPVGAYNYSWTGVADASTSIESLTLPLQDYQIQLPDSTIAGARTTVGLLEVTGLRGSGSTRSADSDRSGVDGMSPGMSFLTGRTVGVTWLLVTPGAVETALQILTRNWQNTNDPSTIVMTARDYLMQVAGGGSRLVSALQIQIPGRPVPYMVFGKPGKLDSPVNSAYQAGWVQVSSEWFAPDGKLYDTTVNNATAALPSSNGGAAFPWTFPVNFGPSTGGTVQVLNGGLYPAKPVFRISGPITNPTITNPATGQYVRVNLSIGSGDVLLVDSDSRVVRLNGANRNTALDVGSSFFTIPPGGTSLSFSSTDSGFVSGALAVYTLNTYSAA